MPAHLDHGADDAQLSAFQVECIEPESTTSPERSPVPAAVVMIAGH